MPRPPDAVMVTPSHQYPLGGRLPVAARLELVEWARAADAIVLEDDYDSEYRHLGPPLPALASLDDAGRVVLVGSFSKVLTPWLRLGYLVLPANPALRGAVARVRADEPCPVPGVAQDAAAALLASGAVRRHIAVTRRDYAHRRRLVLEVLDGIRERRSRGSTAGCTPWCDCRTTRHPLPSSPGSRPRASRSRRSPTTRPCPATSSPASCSATPGVSDTLLAEGLGRIRDAILDLATRSG